MSTTLRVESYFNDEACNWHYRVPDLHIIGGGTASHADAERHCVDAISFVLQVDPNDYDYDYDSDAVTLDVSVAPAA